MKKTAIAILVLVGVLVSTVAPSPAWAHGRGGPGVVIGGVAAGIFAALTFPLWAFAATVPYAPPPVYTPPVVYAPPAVYAPAPPARVVYQPAPRYAGPPPPPQVRREVVYPDGRYLLYGDGVRQPWQWVWIATPSAPPPPPPPR